MERHHDNVAGGSQCWTGGPGANVILGSQASQVQKLGRSKNRAEAVPLAPTGDFLPILPGWAYVSVELRTRIIS